LPLERLQKILARAGLASRREAERIIQEGRVSVNGRIITQLGFKADPTKDYIKVDGKSINQFEPKVIILLNKPKGYVSTVKDPKGRPTVIDLLKKIKWRVYPVGRLDFDAEGLLFLTNDGELAFKLSHPRFLVPRTYMVKVSGIVEEKELLRLNRGIRLEDGVAKAELCELVKYSDTNSWIKIVVTEGRNRLIKRMFLAIGHPVLKLKRIQFGPIKLGKILPGEFRFLTHEEVKKLKEINLT
jgi:pseudouridine synthase